VARLLAGPGGARLEDLEETTRRRFFLIGKEGEHLDHFRVLDQGTLEKVFPALPVDVGQEVDLKLGEVGLHDPDAGVGKLDGLDIVVGDAAQLVGKKVRARIAAVGEGIAWASLLAPVDQAEPPLTAEAEAERPTRTRKPTAAKVEEPEPVEEPEEEEEPVEEAVADDAEAPKKKRTRRGSRGGRNRKKKTAAAGANGAAPEEQAADTVESEPPVIHVPERDLGDGDSEAPRKKRTRRGSRGGRNRRKKTATTSATEAAVDAPPDEPSTNGNDEWEYTPMSEWDLGGD
jgi:predicted RNA-binding protein with TRAM domain